MSDNYNLENMPQEGTPEYDQYMRSRFGDDYELGYRVGFGRRLGAALIDAVVTSMIYMIVMFVTGDLEKILSFTNPLEHIAEISIIMAETTTISTVLFIIYYSTEVLFGTSLGKMLLRIKIASANRVEASTSTLLIRYLVKHSSNFLNIIAIIGALFWLQGIASTISFIILIGFFFTLGRKRQAFHDMIAGTAVYYNENIKNY